MRRLGLPPEAEPRVLRFLEDELEAALAAQSEDAFSASDVEAAGGGAELVEALRAQRSDRARAAALRRAGLADLSAEELAQVVAAAKGR